MLWCAFARVSQSTSERFSLWSDCLYLRGEGALSHALRRIRHEYDVNGHSGCHTPISAVRFFPAKMFVGNFWDRRQSGLRNFFSQLCPQKLKSDFFMRTDFKQAKMFVQKRSAHKFGGRLFYSAIGSPEVLLVAQLIRLIYVVLADCGPPPEFSRWSWRPAKKKSRDNKQPFCGMG